MNPAEQYLKQRIQMRQEANSLGITDSQLEIILYLGTKENPQTIGTIQKNIPYMSQASHSQSISDLWKNKKLVNKKLSMENQRERKVDLTDSGKQVYQNLIDVLEGEN